MTITRRRPLDGPPARRGRVRGVLATVLAAALALSTAGPAAAATDPDLLLSYDFSRVTGTTVPDSSPNGHDGTIRGVGATVSGDILTLPGGAPAGDPGYVQLPTGLFDGRNTLTISAWLKNETAAGNYAAMFFGSAASTPAQYWLLNPRNPANRYKTVITNGSAPSAPWGSEYGISPTNAAQGVAGPTTTNAWGLYTTVITPTSITGYLDGAKIGTVATTRTVSQFGTGLVAYIGRSSYPDPRYKGGVRDVEVYTSAKSDSWVRDSYWTAVEPSVRDAALASDAAALSIEPRSVSSDIALPALGARGSTITWSSSAPSLITSDGRVTRPSGTQDVPVRLTATVTLGGASTTRDIDVTVLAADPQADLTRAAERFVLRPTIVSGEALPVAGSGLAVDWSSPTPGVSITGGVLTTTTGAAAAATVTATLRNTDGSAARAVRTFDVTVLPATEARFLLGYERTPLAQATYGSKVAYSLHLGLGATRSSFDALNGNDGVLFAEGVPSGTLDILDARTLRDPYLFELDGGGYGVIATRALADGTDDASAADSFLLFTTTDLEHFTEVGTIGVGLTTGVNEPRAVWDSASGVYRVTWTSNTGTAYSAPFTDIRDGASRGAISVGALSLDEQVPTTTIPGAVPNAVLAVGADVAEALRDRFGRVANTSVSVPEITVASGGTLDLAGTKARLGYSDGSTAERGVTWNASDLAAVNTSVAGEYSVRGTVRQPDYSRPFIPAEADPDILKWKGSYYFISTDDAGVGINARNMYLRKASTIEGLRTAADHSVAGLGGTADIRGCFWAPELHEIGGTLAIYFAPCVGAASWMNVQAHVQTLRTGGDPTVAADWTAPQPVLTATGGRLQLDAAHPGISLDMTVFEDAGTTYAAWSQRYIAGPVGDAEIWIATMDPADPARLTSTPKKLVTSEYGWDMNTSNVAEGPYAITRDGVVNLTYSGSNIDTTYAVGLLTATSGSDLTEQSNWTKGNAPILNSTESINELGPGHNSFTTDEDGNTLLVYHAKSSASSFRDTYLRTVHWAADGRPILDMTMDELVAPANRSVTATVVVEAPTSLDVTAVASTRCVAGKVVLTVVATNGEEVPVSLDVRSSAGNRAFTAVAPGKNASAAFTTRAGSLAAGEAVVTATATVSGQLVTTPITASYAARQCG